MGIASEPDRVFAGEYAIVAGEPTYTRCRVTLADTGISVAPEGAAEVPVPFAEVEDVVAEDYVITVALADQKTISLRGFGKRTDAFRRELGLLHEAWLSKALLLSDGAPLAEIPGKARFASDPDPWLRRVRARVYPASISLIFDATVCHSIAFSEIEAWGFEKEDYAFHFRLDTGEGLVIGQLGKRTDECGRVLEEVVAKADARAAASLQLLVPRLPPERLRALSGILRDGRPVARARLEKVAPEAWKALEDGVRSNEVLRRTSEWLAQRGDPSAIHIGFKDSFDIPATGEAPAAIASQDGSRALMYFFLYPVSGEKGTFIAFEITSDTGHATYFFRKEDLDPAGLGRDLRRIQFRREPIHLSDEGARRTGKPEILYAARKLPALARLRKAFAGRAVHASEKGWITQAERILAR